MIWLLAGDMAGDMDGHVESSKVGYDGTHGGFGYGYRNADASEISDCRRTKLSHLQQIFEGGVFLAAPCRRESD